MQDFIETYDGALSHVLCRDIIDAVKDNPLCQPGRTGGGVDPSKKLSMDVSLNQHVVFHPLLAKVQQRLSEYLLQYFTKYVFALIGPMALSISDPLSGQPISVSADNIHNLSKVQLTSLVNHVFRMGEITAQRYLASKGGYPYWHSEVYPQPPHNDALHRILLFMFYLNDVTEGGETDFFYQQRSVTPVEGRLVIAPAYFTHTHRGNVPQSGDKYVLTSWILFRRAEHLYAQPNA